MATTYKTLGQLNPTAATLSTLYSCPAATQAIASSIIVCNQSNLAATYRIAIRKNGVAINASQYIVYDATIAANSTVAYTLGITVDADDIISVYASSALISFNVFGSEIA